MPQPKPSEQTGFRTHRSLFIVHCLSSSYEGRCHPAPAPADGQWWLPDASLGTPAQFPKESSPPRQSMFLDAEAFRSNQPAGRCCSRRACRPHYHPQGAPSRTTPPISIAQSQPAPAWRDPFGRADSHPSLPSGTACSFLDGHHACNTRRPLVWHMPLGSGVSSCMPDIEPTDTDFNGRRLSLSLSTSLPLYFYISVSLSLSDSVFSCF